MGRKKGKKGLEKGKKKGRSRLDSPVYDYSVFQGNDRKEVFPFLPVFPFYSGGVLVAVSMGVSTGGVCGEDDVAEESRRGTESGVEDACSVRDSGLSPGVSDGVEVASVEVLTSLGRLDSVSTVGTGVEVLCEGEASVLVATETVVLERALLTAPRLALFKRPESSTLVIQRLSRQSFRASTPSLDTVVKEASPFPITTPSFFRNPRIGLHGVFFSSVLVPMSEFSFPTLCAIPSTCPANPCTFAKVNTESL